MDDLTGKLETLLSDPESLRNLQELAEMLKGKSVNAEEAVSGENVVTSDGPPLDLGKIMAVGQAMRNMENNENVEFLMALKPILSDGRRKRVEQAVRILRLYSVAEVLREQGLLRDIFGGEEF